MNEDDTCAFCLSEGSTDCETDSEGNFWTYCAICDEWTDHGQLTEAE